MLFTRQFLLSQTDNLLVNLRSNNNELGGLLNTMRMMEDISYNKLYAFDHTDLISGSLAGNNVYGKSTQRMASGIASYYSQTSDFLDILTKREHLLRDY